MAPDASPVTTFYLEMRASTELRPAPRQDALEVRECEGPQFEVNRFLYRFVGHGWEWTEKLGWSDAAWRAWAEDPMLRTWIAYHRGSPAGYWPAGGCQSSSLLPSGSMTQPNLPYSDSSTLSTTSTPSARRAASTAWRSSTR